MDKHEKKSRRKQWKRQQRAIAREQLPLSPDELKAMFDMLDLEMKSKGCDRTRRLTEHWLRKHDHDVESVLTWLDRHGGYCDCTVLANVEQHVDDALHEAE